ncbi:MAG: RNA methyltransferase [Pseudomonadota bacterium]|jgi:TrmH family RNA methyltransferase|nr:RNA methyltransferase [Pseudomonadota bacterium]
MKLDEIKKLQQKKYRHQLGACLVEGEHLVLELQQALQTRPELGSAQLYLTAEYRDWPTPLAKQEISSRQMRALSATRSPQGIVALVPIAAIRSQPGGEEIAIYLHEVQDPGNLGTILRTLAWFGGFRCLLSPNSVDPFNPKVIRASMGAIFHVPLELEVPLQSLAARFGRIGCLDLQGEPLTAAAFSRCDCYLFGNEARGLPREQLDSLAVRRFTIAGAGQIESLNLATAVSLSVYERRR